MYRLRPIGLYVINTVVSGIRCPVLLNVLKKNAVLAHLYTNNIPEDILVRVCTSICSVQRQTGPSGEKHLRCVENDASSPELSNWQQGFHLSATCVMRGRFPCSSSSRRVLKGVAPRAGRSCPAPPSHDKKRRNTRYIQQYTPVAKLVICIAAVVGTLDLGRNKERLS